MDWPRHSLAMNNLSQVYIDFAQSSRSSSFNLLSAILSVCFNSSETAGSASIKLATIDHHPMVSVRGFVMSWCQ